jgi:hypothetical protein
LPKTKAVAVGSGEVVVEEATTAVVARTFTSLRVGVAVEAAGTVAAEAAGTAVGEATTTAVAEATTTAVGEVEALSSCAVGQPVISAVAE